MNQAYDIGLAHVGEDVIIRPLAKIVSPEAISIGDSVMIDDFVLIAGHVKTVIGSFIHISCFASCTGSGELTLGDFVSLSSGTRVFTGNDDYLGGSLANPTVPPEFRSPVRSYVHIKKHVIVGANTVILPGVTIEEGVAIGANSLVKVDCEPWTVYAGCPARPLKARPSERMMELEARLRAELYDAQGKYIPKRFRTPSEAGGSKR
jgi:acetyltransferase-like isoleucine patch superfamily enzyme